MKVGLHPVCGMKINARLLRPAPELNKCGNMQMVVQCLASTGPPEKFHKLHSQSSKAAAPTQSQPKHRRQLHPTRPLEDRPSGRECTNHLRGLPFPSRGQGDLAQGSLAVAGVVSWSSCWSLPLNLNRIVPARLTPSPHVLLTRQQLLHHHLRLTVSCHSSTAQRSQRNTRGGGRAWAEYGTLSPYQHPTSISRPIRPLFVHALTSNTKQTAKFLLPSPSRSFALSDTPLPVPISLRTLCAVSYSRSITPNQLPETHQR